MLRWQSPEWRDTRERDTLSLGEDLSHQVLERVDNLAVFIEIPVIPREALGVRVRVLAKPFWIAGEGGVHICLLWEWDDRRLRGGARKNAAVAGVTGIAGRHRLHP